MERHRTIGTEDTSKAAAKDCQGIVSLKASRQQIDLLATERKYVNQLYSTAMMASAKRRRIAIAFFTITASVCAASLTFKQPTIVGEGYDMAGYQGFGDGYALGTDLQGWVATEDGGESWFRWASPSTKLVGGVSDSILTGDHRRHNLGDVAEVQNKDETYCSFNSTTSTAFAVVNGSFDAETVQKLVVFKGIPKPCFSCGNGKHLFGCPFRTGGRGYVRLLDDTLVMSVIVYWGEGGPNNPTPHLRETSTSVVAFRSVDEGFTWEYSGSILNAAQVPMSEEGPNENDLTLLKDGETIMCVVRLDAGDGQVSHPYLPYHRIISTDGGFTWGTATSLGESVGCARPRLMRTAGGQIVLSGGRLGPHNRDTLVWLNHEGDGKVWDPHSVTYWHNRLVRNSSLLFTPAVNDSTARQTMSYTSLVRTGNQTGYVLYARRLPDTPDVAFAMRFEVSS